MLAQLVARIKLMFTNPRAYWDEFSAEPGDLKALLVPKVLLLAALPAAGSLIGGILGSLWLPPLAGMRVMGALLFAAALQYGITLALWIGTALLIDALASTFGAQRDQGQALKLSFGAMLPMWLAGSLAVIPFGALAALAGIASFFYGGYLLHLGLPKLNGTPEDKALVYAISTIGILFVAAAVVFPALSCIRGCATASAFL